MRIRNGWECEMVEIPNIEDGFWRWTFAVSKNATPLSVLKLAVRFVTSYFVFCLIINTPFAFLMHYDLATRSWVTHHDTSNKKTREIGKLAEQGDSKSMTELAYLYSFGKGGLGEDNCAALRWNDRAARQNEPEAQGELAEAYIRGRGVVRNEVLAFYWAKHALKNGLVPSQVSFTIERALNSLDTVEIAEWKDFRPEDQPPAKIYDWPNLGFLESYLFFPVETCNR